jgi:hypothetical protein
MKKLKFGLLGAVVVAGVTATTLVQHSARMQLRTKDEFLRRQQDEIKQLQTENERLSTQAGPAQTSPTLSPEQLHELLRLRSEVGRLRQARSEAGQLQATNVLLRAALEKSESELAALRAAPNFLAKEQFAFAGYATPESTVRSVIWAMNRGDVKSLAASLPPENRAVFEKRLAEQSEASVAAETKRMQEAFSPLIGFRILDQQATSATQVVASVSFDEEGESVIRKFELQKFGNEWKLHEVSE